MTTSIDQNTGIVHLTRLTVRGPAADNPYELHRRLWLAFPDMPQAERPFLFHVEWGRRPVQGLMQSTLAPRPLDWSDCTVEPTRACRLQLRSDVLHRFILWANPTRRDARTRQRVALSGDEERVEWLARRLQPAAALLSANVDEARTLRFVRKRREGVVEAVRFSGVLRVDDASELQGLILDGVGPAKSFGCGLLVLAGV